jgi:hypothetical protein
VCVCVCVCCRERYSPAPVKFGSPGEAMGGNGRRECGLGAETDLSSFYTLQGTSQHREMKRALDTLQLASNVCPAVLEI